MLLVSCISLAGSLMLIHCPVVCAVDTGKLKLPSLKRKSKKHYDFFSPIIGIVQLHQKLFLGNLSVVSSHAFSVSARILPFFKITHPGTHTSTATSVSGVEKRALESSAWLPEYLSSSPAYIYPRNHPLCLYTLCQGTTDNMMGIRYVV